MSQGHQSLSDKEKQTLRLLLVGYDAKSAARHLGLSVHTVNERLRDARRKLAVSSSREAARLLHECEAALPDHPHPQSLGHTDLGEAGPDKAAPSPALSDGNPRILRRPVLLYGGVLIMSLILATLAMSLLTPDASPSTTAETAVAPSPENGRSVEAARRWLALVDAGQWNDSWLTTAQSFRELNTVQVWSDVSQRVRTPLGAMRSRQLVSVDDVPAPPAGYMMVRFRTDFANRAGATETLTLVDEGGVWRVSGIYIE